MRAEYEGAPGRDNAAFDRLRADMANRKIWIFAPVFGAVAAGVTLGLAPGA